MKTPVAYALIVLTLVVYLAGNPSWLWLWPFQSGEFHAWQLATYVLAHGNWLHLVLNLLALLCFGPTLERAWGHARFALAYVACGVLAGMVHMALVISDRPVLGASGALFGMFTAFVLLHPTKRIITILPVPLPAWAVLGLYVALSIAALAFQLLPGVAHAVHLGGVLAGVLCYLAYSSSK